MKKSMLAFLLILCLMCMGLAHAEGEVVNGIYKTGLPIAAEDVTLRIAVARHTGDQSKSYATKPFAKRAAEDTGIAIDWIEMTVDVDAQVSVMLASGDDMPDVFLCNLGDLYTKNMELFADISDLIPEYAPHVKECYDAWGVDWGMITEDDGSIRRLLTGMYSNPGNIPGDMMWIDKSWLDNLGLEMPTTTDELYDVLKAFKEQDADGDGDPNNEIPLDFTSDNIHKWAVSWGASGTDNNTYYIIKDGTVLPTANTDGYRAYLEYFHKLYAEGLINPEGFTQTGDQFNANLKAQRDGCWIAWSPQGSRGTSAEADKCTFIGIITAEGYDYAYPGNNSISINRYFAIAANSKHIEAALRWWDYLSSTDELRWLTARGPEGLCWIYGEDGVTHYVHDGSPEERQQVFEAYGMTEDFDVSMPGAAFYMDSHFPLIEKNTSYAPPAEGDPGMSQGYMRYLGQTLLGDLITEGQSLNVVPSDIAEEYSFACEGLADYIKSFRADAIINGVTDATWDAYLEELSSYNYDYYLKYYQMQYDGVYE